MVPIKYNSTFFLIYWLGTEQATSHCLNQFEKGQLRIAVMIDNGCNFNFTEHCWKQSDQQYASIGLDNGLAPKLRQATIGTNDGLINWSIYASPGLLTSQVLVLYKWRILVCVSPCPRLGLGKNASYYFQYIQRHFCWWAIILKSFQRFHENPRHINFIWVLWFMVSFSPNFSILLCIW